MKNIKKIQNMIKRHYSVESYDDLNFLELVCVFVLVMLFIFAALVVGLHTGRDRNTSARNIPAIVYCSSNPLYRI